MDPLLHIHRLDFTYGDRPVLAGVDLHVETGTTLGVIGPNGGGKTTLLRLLLGLLEPTRGEIRVAGLSPRQATRRGDVIGYLPQAPAVPERLPLTVRQVVRLGLAGKTGVFRSTPRQDLAFADSLIDRVGIADIADRPVAALSGGQLQRTFIARALAPRPKLLLLDEPTTGIDAAGQKRFIDFLQQLQRELGLTVVLVSHDLRAVSAVADRIACLNVTLHFHDVPQRMPIDLAEGMFACGLDVFGVPHAHDTAGAACCPPPAPSHAPMANFIFRPADPRPLNPEP